MKYTKEMLEPIVRGCYSIRQVLLKLGLKETGGNYVHIKSRIDKFGINRDHFSGQGWSKGKQSRNRYSKESFIKNILCKNGKGWKTHYIKLRLYKLGLKEEKCEICGQENLWNGNRLGMHLDHENGDIKDNRLENLRVVCPNCHTQTKTYSNQK